MKKSFFIVVTVILFGFVCIICSSCSAQSRAKNFGGTINIDLEPNDKLLEITWKDDSLWILTKQMQENDIAEEYKFQEKDSLGLLEGTVTIKETKLSPEEMEEFKTQKQLEEDYNKNGNFVYSDNDITKEPTIVFIRYDETTGKYEKIKDYVYDESTDSLIEKK